MANTETGPDGPNAQLSVAQAYKNEFVTVTALHLVMVENIALVNPKKRLNVLNRSAPEDHWPVKEKIVMYTANVRVSLLVHFTFPFICDYVLFLFTILNSVIMC